MLDYASGMKRRASTQPAYSTLNILLLCVYDFDKALGETVLSSNGSPQDRL